MDEERLESWLYAYAGRFALVLVRPAPLVYPDSAASLPLVFSQSHERVSSSPFLLYGHDELVDSALVDQVDTANTDRCFVLGAASVQGAEEVLLNHVLDLRTWSTRRHWPSEPFEEDSVESGLQRIGDVVAATLDALAKVADPNVSLTAGIDSRTLLACSREVCDRLRFFTVALPDDYGAIDVGTGPRLASRFGLEHRTLPWCVPSRPDVEQFVFRTGCMVGEQRGRLAGPTHAQLGGTGAYVAGLGGEEIGGIGLGTGGWRPGDHPGTRLSGADLVERQFFPVLPELVRRADEWLAGLSSFNTLDTIALLQLEMRLGCRGGPLTTAFPDAYTFTTYPFGDRRIVDAAFRFPLAYRQEARVRQDLIRLRWPELLAFDFNRRPLKLAARQTAARFTPPVARRAVKAARSARRPRQG